LTKAYLRREPLFLLDTLTQGSDQVANVADWDLDGEIDRSKHLGKEDPPTGQCGHEPERASSDLQSLRHFCVT